MLLETANIEAMPTNLAEWQEAICGRLMIEFPDTIYIAVFGSILTHRFSADSDIDIILLYDGEERNFNHTLLRCHVCQDRFLEVELQPMHRLLQHYDMAKRMSSPILCRQVHSSVVLKDDLHLHEGFKDLADKILAEGPHPLSEIEMQRLRRRLYVRLSDYEKSQASIEKQLLRDDIILVMETLTFRLAGRWLNQSSVWTYRELQEIHSIFSDQLLILIRDRTIPPTEAAHSLLKALGGPPADGFRLQI